MARAASSTFQDLLCSRRAQSDRLSRPLLPQTSPGRDHGRGGSPANSLPPLMEAVFPFFTASDLCALCATDSGMRDMMEEPSASKVLLDWAKGKAWFGEFDRQVSHRQPSQSPDDGESGLRKATTAAAVRGFVSMRGRRLQAEASAKQRTERLLKWLSPFALTVTMVLFVGLGSKFAEDSGITEPPLAVIALFSFVFSLIASLVHVYTAAYSEPVATLTSVATAAMLLSRIDTAYCCAAWQDGSLRVYGCLHLIAAGAGALGWLCQDADQGKDKRGSETYRPRFHDHRLR